MHHLADDRSQGSQFAMDDYSYSSEFYVTYIIAANLLLKSGVDTDTVLFHVKTFQSACT